MKNIQLAFNANLSTVLTWYCKTIPYQSSFPLYARRTLHRTHGTQETSTKEKNLLLSTFSWDRSFLVTFEKAGKNIIFYRILMIPANAHRVHIWNKTIHAAGLNISRERKNQKACEEIGTFDFDKYFYEKLKLLLILVEIPEPTKQNMSVVYLVFLVTFTSSFRFPEQVSFPIARSELSVIRKRPCQKTKTKNGQNSRPNRSRLCHGRKIMLYYVKKSGVLTP